MSITVLVAGCPGALDELHAADGVVELVGRVRSLDEAQEALRVLRPAVLVLDVDLTHRGSLCSLPALRRASPGTAIVLPPAGEHGPRLVRAVRMAAQDFERRRDQNGLTGRERDVVRLVALGHTNTEVADRLTLSVRTIETHRARIQRRLGLSTRAELVRWALDHGMLES
ncbi:MAG TPA: response regulator transcription factor [Thermoleophilaceae bacterium]|nr:response regulator transcription factor [Thermoleophilaceae bacterium]